ncbi:hypothetical protein ACFQV2_20995 [Actinokineospora soli]|uniref:Uncharacterized protein n=1 Tax=Actinokineospora soli TaxID=1048753 RepID=A0ABW2TRJ4_9PSEU
MPAGGRDGPRLPELVEFARDAYWSFVEEHSAHFDLLRAGR